MLTPRDLKVIDFLETFKAASTSTICNLFFPSIRMAQNRMRIIKNNCKDIQLHRQTFGSEYIYTYKNPPKQLRHTLLVSQMYGAMNKLCDVARYSINAKFDGVIPDATIAYEVDGVKQLAFIEVELSNKGLDVAKYERLYLSQDYLKFFPVFPRLIVVTNKKVPSTQLDLVVVSEDLSDINKILGK